jgi:hypothetical protein
MSELSHTVQFSYKQLLCDLAAASCTLPIISVGFCKNDDVMQAFYSNDGARGVIRERRGVSYRPKGLLLKLASQHEAHEKAVYVVFKDSRKLLTAREAALVGDGALKGLDLQSIHVFRNTRHHPELVYKASQVHSSTTVEVKQFAGQKGTELKDERLHHKILLVGKQLASALERLTGMPVCTLVWETVIDEENKAKILYVEVAKLSNDCRATCLAQSSALPAEVSNEPEVFPMKRRMTRDRLNVKGYEYFLEMLYKQFEVNEKQQITEARLAAIKDKYAAQPSDSSTPSLDYRLRSLIDSSLPQLGKPQLSRTGSSKEDIVKRVNSYLLTQDKMPAVKSLGGMKPVNYTTRKSLLPTELEVTHNETKNSDAHAVNKFRKERLVRLEIPHYSLKHSLSPSSPDHRLISLLMAEEQNRLKKKGLVSQSILMTSVSTPGCPSPNKTFRDALSNWMTVTTPGSPTRVTKPSRRSKYDGLLSATRTKRPL